jgi:uncharacterized protein (TIGR03083 family)
MDFNRYIAAESSRFADVIEQAPPDARVPSCPDWSADDLLWHLAEVQYFWGTVVLDQVDGGEAEKRNPARPVGRAGLLDFYLRASDRLAGALDGADPGAHAWTWSDDQTVGFIQRRQAQEALIHRVDAELTTGRRTPIDQALAVDGVDETLRVMYGGCPSWGTISPDPGRGTIRLRATDTSDSWLVTLARFTGTDPDDGKTYDEPDIQVAPADPGGTAAAEITGTAADLDCWLWNREPAGPVERSGDPAVLAGFEEEIVKQPIN